MGGWDALVGCNIAFHSPLGPEVMEIVILSFIYFLFFICFVFFFFLFLCPCDRISLAEAEVIV